MKKVIWHPKARNMIRTFPKEVRNDLGYLVYLLQRGEKLHMPYSKHIPAVAIGVSELRLRGADGIYRAFYYLKHGEGILLFHCFKKKTQKTPLKEIEQGIKNLKELL